jgi:hypothetical protein
MNAVKFIFSVWICLGVVLAIGCSSSSSSPPGANVDSGTIRDSSIAEAGTSTPCDPFRLELCPQGQTCCFSGLSGRCTDVGSCAGAFQVGCVNASTCAGGEVCCGSVQLPVGFDASAYVDASFDAAAFDASGFGLTLQCQTACAATQYLACVLPQDCPSGQMCGAPMGMDGAVPLIPACFPMDAGVVALPPDSGPAADGGPSDAAGLDGGVEGAAAADGG